ncbi:MAG TPA: hypothetical protein P5346_00945 [Spirochaetota bacterium]|nr:hypothetical protein [Spirochaetota bacterium]
MKFIVAVCISMTLIFGCAAENSGGHDKGFEQPGSLYDRVDNDSNTTPNEYVFKSRTIPNKSWTFAGISQTCPTSTGCAAIVYQDDYKDKDKEYFAIMLKAGDFALKIYCRWSDSFDKETVVDPDYISNVYKTSGNFTAEMTIGGGLYTEVTGNLDVDVEWIPSGCGAAESCSLADDEDTYDIYRITFNESLSFGTNTIGIGDTIYAQKYPLP